MATDQELIDNRNFRRRTIVVALVILGIAATIWLVVQLRSLLFMVFVALFVAVAMEPPVHWLAKRGWRRGMATGAVFLVGLVTAVFFIWAWAPLLIDQVNQITGALPGYVDSLLLFLADTFDLDLTELGLETEGLGAMGYLEALGGSVLGSVVGLTATVGGFFIFLTTVALFSFYMVADLPKLQRTILSFMPEKEQRRAMHIWDIAVEKMGGYIYSRLILAVVSGAIAATFLSFLRVPFAISLGLWVGVLSQFIPVVGTYLAAVLPAIVALSARGPSTMIWVLVFFIAYQQLENYVFSPRITRRTMEIHPAVSVAAIFVGASLLGGIGVILALPMAGIIQAILSESGKRHDVILDGPIIEQRLPGGGA